MCLDGPIDPSFDGMGFLKDILVLFRLLAERTGIDLKDVLSLDRASRHLSDFWGSLFEKNQHLGNTKCDDNKSNDDCVLELMKWLGLSPKTTANDADALSHNQLLADVELHLRMNDSAKFFWCFIETMKGQREKEKIDLCLRYLGQLDRFLARNEWFRRVWVLQEVGSNAVVRLLHANQEIEWNSLEAVDIIRAGL